MNEPPLIRLKGLSKVYTTEELETRALSGIDLDIHHNDFLSIAGPSGCGKSSLLSILGLLDRPSQGSFRLKGRPVENLDRKERARFRNREIGFIFQAFNLIGNLTVLENTALPLHYRKMSAGQRRQLAEAALEKVGMTHRRDHRPSQLSGGQQQRVAVARALAGDPAMVLADEPTGNLDTKNSAMVMELLSELHRDGATICMVTHNPDLVAYATRQVSLLDGRIVADDPRNTDLEKPPSEKLAKGNPAKGKPE